jgi:hypothetical protein
VPDTEAVTIRGATADDLDAVVAADNAGLTALVDKGHPRQQLAPGPWRALRRAVLDRGVRGGGSRSVARGIILKLSAARATFHACRADAVACQSFCPLP